MYVCMGYAMYVIGVCMYVWAGELQEEEGNHRKPKRLSAVLGLRHPHVLLLLSSMYVCMYVCMYVLYVCWWYLPHVCMHVCMNVCMYVCMYVCIVNQDFTCMCVCLIYVCMCVCMIAYHPKCAGFSSVPTSSFCCPQHTMCSLCDKKVPFTFR